MRESHVTAGWGQEMLAYLDCQYPDVHLPICGSDGLDYFNHNQLMCVATKHPERSKFNLKVNQDNI